MNPSSPLISFSLTLKLFPVNDVSVGASIMLSPTLSIPLSIGVLALTQLVEPFALKLLELISSLGTNNYYV